MRATLPNPDTESAREKFRTKKTEPNFENQNADPRPYKKPLAPLPFEQRKAYSRVGFSLLPEDTTQDAPPLHRIGPGCAEWLEADCPPHRFRSNEVRLWLSVIAYNLENLWRRLVLPRGSTVGR